MPGASWFLKAVLKEPEKFRNVLDKFAHISQKVMEAWASTDTKLFVSHDDICNAQGARDLYLDLNGTVRLFTPSIRNSGILLRREG